MAPWLQTTLGVIVAGLLACYLSLIFLRQLSRILEFTCHWPGKHPLIDIIRGDGVWNRWPLPVFTYFSHLPDRDIRVFSRGISPQGEYSAWRSAGYRHPGIVRWLFNPDRRRAKVLKDNAAQLLDKVELGICVGEDSFLASSEYRLLLRSAASQHADHCAIWQFLICGVSISQAHREPEVLFISRPEALFVQDKSCSGSRK